MSDLFACTHDAAPIISAIDPDVADLFPPEFHALYEVHSFRNAARILAHACRDEFDEIIGTLMAFRIRTEEIVTSGGNKSRIAKNMEDLLNPLGWNETRIQGDLFIRKIITVQEPRAENGARRKGPATRQHDELFKIERFIDGHKIDFVKGRVSFDMEWNSKDQTFDRDLYAARTFYECGVVSAGVLLTRSAELVPLFQDIARRVDMKDFHNKYGASTTWMPKLLYRLNAGRSGGCPILVLGIKPALVSDFEEWKREHPVIRQAKFEVGDGPAAESEEG
ncbi:BglII/BstYI family type II restriction endonuclease [Azospirillum sp. sgz302134]